MEVCCVGCKEVEIGGWCYVGVWMIKSCEWRVMLIHEQMGLESYFYHTL